MKKAPSYSHGLTHGYSKEDETEGNEHEHGLSLKPSGWAKWAARKVAGGVARRAMPGSTLLHKAAVGAHEKPTKLGLLKKVVQGARKGWGRH